MNDFLHSVTQYQKQFGFSTIPVNPGKKPYIPWAEFQNRKPSPQEIEAWALKYPEAMIGIVTGSISGVLVIDCDTQEGFESIKGDLPDHLIVPTARTPRGGWHLYFIFPKNSNITIGAGVMPGVDFRGEGGFVVAPPSKNGNGKRYIWQPGLSLEDASPAPLPDALYNKLNHYKGLKNSTLKEVTKVTSSNKMFEYGNRDNDLFHTANCLVKGAMPRHEIEQVLESLMISWGEAPDKKWIQAKVDSALKRAGRKERNTAEEFRQWLTLQDGYIDLTNACTALQLLTKEDKNNLYQIAYRMKNEGTIEKYGNKAGVYRRVDKDFERVDFLSASGEEFQIYLPLDLNDLGKLYPGNICCIAGSKESGKTAFLLNIAQENLRKKRIVYLNSEMGRDEIRNRLLLFQDVPLTTWDEGMAVYNLKTTQTPADFIDGSDTIWIVDYLEIAEDFSKIALPIAAMHEKLGKGIAFIAIQKADNREIGRGADFSREKARLYLSLDWDAEKKLNRIKIIDCKAWRSPNKNPRSLVRYYKLFNGSKLLPKTEWA